MTDAGMYDAGLCKGLATMFVVLAGLKRVESMTDAQLGEQLDYAMDRIAEQPGCGWAALARNRSALCQAVRGVLRDNARPDAQARRDPLYKGE
jgi:hypothetical protein